MGGLSSSPHAVPRPGTAPLEAPSGRHWHIGQDEDGNEFEYEVHAHDDDEEGIPVINEETGLPNVRPYNPPEGDVQPGLGFMGQPGEPMSMEDMIAGLMQALTDPEGRGIVMGGNGQFVAGNAGDYVLTQGGGDGGGHLPGWPPFLLM
jgi:hypothetical protein